MGFDLMARILHDPQIKDPTGKLVLLALADCANQKTGECHPSLTRISELSGITRRNVYRIICRLERQNLIKVDRSEFSCIAQEPNGYEFPKHQKARDTTSLGARDTTSLARDTTSLGARDTTSLDLGTPRPQGLGTQCPPNKEEIQRRDKEGSKTPAGAGDLVLASQSSEPEKTKPGRQPKDQAEFTAYCASRKMSPSDAEGLWDDFEANGWKSKTGPLANWEAAVRKYQRNGWLTSLRKAKDSPPKSKSVLY